MEPGSGANVDNDAAPLYTAIHFRCHSRTVPILWTDACADPRPDLQKEAIATFGRNDLQTTFVDGGKGI